MLGRQPGTGGSDEGTGKIPGVPNELIYTDAKDDNEETESDSDDIYKYMINVCNNTDTETKAAKKTADITTETIEQPLTSSSFSVPSDYVLQQATPIPTTTTTPPIITEAPAIIPEILKITPFIALQLRVTKLEQDMSEVKKFDHFADSQARSKNLKRVKKRSNQGKGNTKKRRTRESKSAKKPSTTKESSKGKDLKVGSKTGKSAAAKDPVEKPTKEIIIADKRYVSDPEDTYNAHMPKIPDTTTWFRPILEEERPASPEPEWVIPPINLPEADNNWANAFAKAHQDLDENKLHNK
ncbi:hypothetical protein Tco_0037332, partial [Tanacetum coccineum]